MRKIPSEPPAGLLARAIIHQSVVNLGHLIQKRFSAGIHFGPGRECTARQPQGVTKEFGELKLGESLLRPGKEFRALKLGESLPGDGGSVGSRNTTTTPSSGLASKFGLLTKSLSVLEFYFNK